MSFAIIWTSSGSVSVIPGTLADSTSARLHYITTQKAPRESRSSGYPYVGGAGSLIGHARTERDQRRTARRSSQVAAGEVLGPVPHRRSAAFDAAFASSDGRGRMASRSGAHEFAPPTISSLKSLLLGFFLVSSSGVRTRLSESQPESCARSDRLRLIVRGRCHERLLTRVVASGSGG